METRRELLNSDIFRIASMTKPLTAVAVMMLMEDEKIGLDDPIGDYLTGFSAPHILSAVDLADSTYSSIPSNNQITIRHLLTHTSGIGYGFIDEKLMALYEKAGISEGFEERDISVSDNCQRISQMPIMHPPGEQFTYGLSYCPS